MAKPTIADVWASDATWASGPNSGDATKLTPSAGQQAQGIVAGDTVKSEYLNWLLNKITDYIRWQEQEALNGIFGDASDGDVVVSGSTPLTSAKFYEDLTVQAGGVLSPAGFVVLAKKTITVDSGGVIRRNGNVGTTSRTGGAALSGGSLGGSQAGSAGGTYADALGGSGGAGGAGSGGSAQAGGVAEAPAAGDGAYRALPYAAHGHAIGGGNLTLLKGGAGGGYGGDGGGSNDGGGGGSGGGVIILAAPTITIEGTIEALGGAGADGDGAGSGPGGGGGGGLIYLIYRSKTGAGTVSVAGGAAGAQNGAPGAAVAGSVGRIIEIAT